MKLIFFDWGGAVTVYPANQILKIVIVKSSNIATVRFQGDTTTWELNRVQSDNLIKFLSQHDNKDTPISIKFTLKEKHETLGI